MIYFLNSVIFLLVLNRGLCYDDGRVAVHIARGAMSGMSSLVRMDEVTTISYTTTSSKPSAQCGQRQIPHSPLITNGQSANIGDWPWHVAILKAQSTDGIKYICGGTLLSKLVVLTAGHCVTEVNKVVNPERLSTILGNHKMMLHTSESQDIQVNRIILHPKFNHTTLAHDIALLKLASEAVFSQYIQPICLWNGDHRKSLIFNKSGTIVGYGFNEKGVIGSNLMMAKIPVIDDVTCIRSSATFYDKYLTDYTYCAGFGNGTAACNGDSGGGMYFPEEVAGTTTWHLRGIISLTRSRTEDARCDPRFYTVLTDSARYLNFINSNLN